MPKRPLILLAALLVSFLSSAASEYGFGVRHLDVAPELSNTMINAIYKDSRGFMWIGTSSGLFRYDGFGVSTFRGADRGLTSVLNNYIDDIQEDSQGRLWVQADAEWRIYDPNTGKETDDIGPVLEEMGTGGYVTALMIDKDKNIWLGIEDKGISIVKGGKSVTVPVPAGSGRHVTDIIEIPGGVACVTNNGSLLFVDGKTCKVSGPVKVPDEVPDTREFIYDLYADRSGRLWVISNERLMLYDLKSRKWLNSILPGAGRAGVVKCLFEDRQGNLWVARDHHGLERVETQSGEIRFTPVDMKGGLSANNTVNCFMEDPQGTLWIGTYKRGMFFHNETVDKFHREDFPDTNCIVKGEDNEMWIGTDNAGLWRWDVATGARESVPDPAYGAQPPAITSLLRMPDGTLYIGSFSRGLRKMKDGVFSDVTTGTDLDACYVWALSADPQGKIWAGTLGGGLYRIDPSSGETKAFKESDSGLASDYVLSAMRTRDGKMYFGTSYGLSVYDPVTAEMKSYLNKPSEESPGSQNVNQVYEDSRGLVWLATRNGLRVIDRQHNKLHNVRLLGKISQLFILGVIEDNGGSMWVSEGSNLINLKVMYDEKTGTLQVTPHVYDGRDDFQNCAFNQRSFAKLSSGEIVVGGLYGIDRFLPADIRYNTARPKVMFTDLYMGGRKIDIGEEVDGDVVMTRGLNSGRGIDISHRQKEFTICFATDNYVLPEKTAFYYKLVGFSKEWTECAQGVNHVTYTNLSPGHYTLLVKAVNGDGYESEAPAELKIYVRPPFWASAWAYVIYAILTVAAIYLVMKMVSRRERRRFEEKRKEDAHKREEEMNQLKFKFFTNVSHDLRTPLTLIVSPLDTMLRESKDEKQTKRLTLMRNNAMKLLNLVNQLLDFRKMEMKGLQLNPSEGDIVAFAKGVCGSFLNLSERKNINLTFYSSRDRIEMMFDPDKMEKILMNLLGNAFKFTPAGGRVDVSLEVLEGEKDMLRIKVADTGPGVSDKDKPHIFERFYQVDDNGDPHPGMGSGIGLSMVSEYVRLHEGTVRVTDNVDHGSVFVIDLPLRSHASAERMPVLSEQGASDRSDLSGQSDQSDQSVQSDQSDKPEKGVRRGRPGKEDKGLPVALVVDDNPDMMEMMKEDLEDDFDVVTASDGIEALEKLRTVCPAIIVADLMMPRLDGIELTRRLKSSPDTSAIPLVILTARHDLDTKVEGLTLGADDYITKPFNIDLLRLRMNKLISLSQKGMRRSHIDPEPEEIRITPLDEKMIGKAVEYVSRNMDSPELSVEELASHMGMSRVRLYKKMKLITGKTPIEFIRVIRLKRAAQLLRESQLNISEIAYQTGFNNPKVFSRYFKEEFGILPSVYQNREEKETNYTV